MKGHRPKELFRSKALRLLLPAVLLLLAHRSAAQGNVSVLAGGTSNFGSRHVFVLGLDLELRLGQSNAYLDVTRSLGINRDGSFYSQSNFPLLSILLLYANYPERYADAARVAQFLPISVPVPNGVTYYFRKSAQGQTGIKFNPLNFDFWQWLSKSETLSWSPELGVKYYRVLRNSSAVCFSISSSYQLALGRKCPAPNACVNGLFLSLKAGYQLSWK